MNQNDLLYYQRRLAEEKTRAETASCAEAKAVHGTLAKQYNALLYKPGLGRAADLLKRLGAIRENYLDKLKHICGAVSHHLHAEE
jgi:hypothetical protein